MPYRYPFFSPKELACRCGACTLGEDDMDARFMRRVVDLRRKCDFPFIVTSAIRCPAHNATVSTTGLDGPHTTGHAIDLKLYGHWAAKVLGLARQYGMTGLGLHQKGPYEERFLHMDDLPDGPGCPRNWTWTY